MLKRGAVIFLIILCMLLTACTTETSDTSADSVLKQAKRDDYVVFEDLEMTKGKHIWQEFYDTAMSGTPGSVNLAYYYTLDKETTDEEYYEAEKDNFPVIFLAELVFDGKEYNIKVWNSDKTELDTDKTYKYLMHYTGKPTSPQAEYKSYDHYILVNDNTVTYEELQWGMLSSRLGDYIDHYRVCLNYNYASGCTKTAYTDIVTRKSTGTSTDNVKGFVIAQDEPTLEEMKSSGIKAYDGSLPIEPEIPEGIYYKCDSQYKQDESLGFDVHDRSFLEKYDGEELLWRVTFTEFEFYDFIQVDGGVIVHGTTPTWSSNQISRSWMSMVDEDGNILWKCQLDNGFDNEYIEAIVENGDGTYAVISRGDFEYFCLGQYDAAGNRTSFNKTKIGNYGIWNAALARDGYIVQFGNYLNDEYAKIIKVDRDGNITESFSYENTNSYWCITDTIEFQGKTYLSAYSVPKCSDDETYGGRFEIVNILNHIDINNLDIQSEKLTQIVRDNYTAMLLICDSVTGIPEKFYSVRSSLGGKLMINDSGELTWDVENIKSTFYSPMTSSFSIGGSCNVFRYTFDENGTLVAHEKTEELTAYRR